MAKKGVKESKDNKSEKSKPDKTTAILAYITWLGFIIAILMNMNEKNKFASFHIRQALLIMILGTIFVWIPIINWILIILLLILWIIGLVGAIEGKEREVPLIGKLAQEWFKGL